MLKPALLKPHFRVKFMQMIVVIHTTAKDLIEAKTDFRKTERHWMAEKEFLMRKVQFLQHYGSVVPSSLDSGGFFTENRSNLRKGGDLKVHRDLQKLNVRIFFHGTFIS